MTEVESDQAAQVRGPLVTKFNQPELPRHHVRRSRVLALFPKQAPPVTAIVAPAGFGKSTIATSWIESLDGESAWLRLDEADQDAARFGRHVAEVVDRATGNPLPSSVSASMAAGSRVAAANRATPLLNHFAHRTEPLHVVLDDYHLAASPNVEELTRYLVQYAPPSLRLCLTSRAQPDLPLSRLRAAGDLAEVTTADLALDDIETGQLISQITGVEVPVEHAAQLQRATEGWPVLAALVAHALAARGEGDLTEILAEVGGDLDSYVLEEVLASLGDDEIDFVRRTSVLDNMTGPLADAVRAGSGSGAQLVRLIRSGFPIVQHGTRSPSYRYHQHVAQTLREDLMNTEPAEEIELLHRRAATWLEDCGQLESALEHALLGRDNDCVPPLFARQWLALVNQGQLDLVRRWLTQMPSGLIESEPALALATAWTNLMAGEVAQVSPFLMAARSFEGEEPILPGASSVASGALLIETIFFRVVGRLSDSLASAEEAMALETEPDAPGRARAMAYAGICRFWKGQYDHASRLLNHAAGVAERFDQRMARLLALGYLGLIEAEQKSADGLREVAADAEALIEEGRLHVHPTAAPALGAMGLLALIEGRPDDAVDRLEKALSVASIQAEPGLMAYLNLAYSQALEGSGRQEEAERRRVMADTLCRRAEDVGFIAARCGVKPGEQAMRDVDLTGREAAVLQLLTSSLTLPEIARELFVSHNTVKTHVQSLYRKLGVTKRADAVRVAASFGVS